MKTSPNATIPEWLVRTDASIVPIAQAVDDTANMTFFSKVARAMQRIAPLELAENAWDNVGVIAGGFLLFSI